MKFGKRFIASIVILCVALSVYLIYENSAAFFANRGKEPLDFDTITISDVSKGRAVSGECIIVYDLIGYGYTEETNKYTNSTNTTTDTYYWLVDCGEQDVMLVKTKASDSISDTMDDIVELYWESGTWEDFAANHTGAAVIDGVFINNDSQIVSFYNDWIDEMQATSDDWKNVKLAPFTLDCTNSLSTRIMLFYLGIGLLALLLIISAAAIAFIVKGVKGGPVQQSAGYSGANYGAMNGGSPDIYGAQGSTSYGPQSGFQAQSNTAYGSQGGFQAQSNTAYGSQGSVQAQSNTAYGSQGGFQAQSNTAYGSQGGFQEQNNTAYGSQGGINYGSSVQSGINYGSTMGGSSPISLDKKD